MTISQARARKLAKRILRDNDNGKGRPYRTIAREDFPMLGADGKPVIKPGTLGRFAKSEGEYVPEKDEILVALGLKKPRTALARSETQEAVIAMSQMVRQGLRLWKRRQR